MILKRPYITLTILISAILVSPPGMAEDNFSLDDGANAFNQRESQEESVNQQATTQQGRSSPLVEDVTPVVNSAPSSGLNAAPPPANIAPAVPRSLPPPKLVSPVAVTPSPARVSEPASQTAHTDAADVEKKNDFPGIFALPGIRRDLSPGEAPEVYTVEEGDTMYDICDQLIDDGSYWPKLWSLNTDVKNPHFIYPGMRLAFYAGDTDNPPRIEVVSEDEVVPVEKSGIQEAELVSQDITGFDAGSEGRSAKVIQGIDDSAPVSVIGPGDIAADAGAADGIIFAGKTFSSPDFAFVLPAVITSDEIEGIGSIVSGPSGERLAGDDKKILVGLSGGSQGGTFSVLRPSGEVESLRSGDSVGYRYEFAGNIRTLRAQKDGLFEAVIFDARCGIQPGDIVVNFMSTRRRVPVSTPAQGVLSAESSVIGFADQGKSAAGEGDLVFLEKSGLSQGGHYAIFKAESLRDIRHQSKDALNSSKQMVAVARVIEISGGAALALIVEGLSEVRTGDTLSPR
jgi:LysM domain